MVVNVLAGVKEFKLSYRKLSPRKHSGISINPDLDTPVLLSLLKDSQLSDDTRDLVLEIILLNLIISLVHKHFFKGRNFFGVGSETHRKYLETMLSKLVAGGKFFFSLYTMNIYLLTISHKSRKLGSCRDSALALYECRSYISDE